MDMKRLEQLQRGYERDELNVAELIELLEGYEDLWEGSKLEKKQLSALLGSQTEGKIDYCRKMLDARGVAKEYLNEWLYMVALKDGIKVALERWAAEVKRHPWLGVELSREPDQKGERWV